MEAEPLYKRALAIREKILDPDHPDVKALRNALEDSENRRQEEDRARKAGKVRNGPAEQKTGRTFWPPTAERSLTLMEGFHNG